MNGHLITTILAGAAALCYLLAGGLGLRLSSQKPANLCWGAAWVLNLAILAIAWAAAGEPPFASIWQVLTVLATCFGPLCLFLEKRYSLAGIRPVFRMGAAFPLIGTLFMEKELVWQKAPALQSVWFVPHVFAYMVAYSLTVAAFLFCCQQLWLGWRGNKRDNDAVIYAVSRTAFPFFTFGMLSGAIWAEDAWGVYWSWDIKETWALITWVLLLLYFHLRAQPGLKKWALPAQACAFASLTVTFLGVSYLPLLAGGLHSYL